MRPHVHALEHDDIYPDEMVEQMKALGLFGATIAHGVRRPRALGHDLRPDRAEGLGGVDVALRHLQLAPDHGGLRGARRHRGAEARAICRASRPASCAAASRSPSPTAAPTCRRSARARCATATHYVVNGTKTWISNGIHGQVLRAAGEDRSRRRAAPQGHEHVPGREGPGLPRVAQAREDRLQGHRFSRADLRGLPRAGRRP